MVPDYGKTHHENHVWNVGERSGHTELPPRAAQGSRLQAGRAAEPLRTASQLRCRSRGQGGGRRRGREGGGGALPAALRFPRPAPEPAALARTPPPALRKPAMAAGAAPRAPPRQNGFALSRAGKAGASQRREPGRGKGAGRGSLRKKTPIKAF